MSAINVGWVINETAYPPGAIFNVLIAIADVANDTYNNECWLTQAQLAERAHCSSSSVRRALRQLVSDGILQPLDTGNGRGNPSRFQLLVSIGKVSTETRKVSTGEHLYDAKGSHSEHLYDRERCSSEERKVSTGEHLYDRERCSSGHLTLFTQIYKDETEVITLDEHLSTTTLPTSLEADFAECWDLYPRKVARKVALAAYQATRRRGVSGENLLLATRHYASARLNEDPQYTMHPSTFYGPHDRWQDYLVPQIARPPTPKRSRFDEAISVVGSWIPTP